MTIDKDKKKILILTPHMKMGGVEISLLRILKYLDYDKVEVTLLLTKSIGPLLAEIPHSVKVKEMKFKNKIAELMVASFQKLPIFERILRKVLRDSFNLKRNIMKSSHNLIYDYCLENVEAEEEHYELVIDYHGYGFFTTAYTARKVSARKKIMWIHDEKMDFLEKVHNYLADFQKFFGVANSCVDIFQRKYPEFSNRIETFYNIIDVESIISKSKEEVKEDEFNGDFKIITIGRLVDQKGYDIAINSAKIIKDLGYKFKWYVIGDGNLKRKLENQIQQNDLSDFFILMGLKTNPFPYLARADLYVQPSRHEGYGLAISEARVLKKPIIATKIDCIMEQINDGINGYLVEIEEKELANRIIDMIKAPEKRAKLINNLQNESDDNKEQLSKIYSML